MATRNFGVRLGSVEFKTLSLEDNLRLVSNFTEEEIKEAVWLCEGSKSPDPYGFSFNFIKNSWEVFKHDITTIVHHF